MVGRHEFADFIFHMAAADLAHSSDPSVDSAPKVMLKPLCAIAMVSYAKQPV